MSYWDTACLVKLYAPEADSLLFRQHAATMVHRLFTGEFARLELWTTLRRKEAEGILAAGEAKKLLVAFDKHISVGVVRVVPLGERMKAEFERVVDICLDQKPPLLIRTLDALHLAAAKESGETEIVTTDKRIREATALLGFALFPPKTL